MFTKTGFQDYSMAYALATGMVMLDDQNGEKELRRARHARRKTRNPRSVR